jgi:hypothetical protein
MLAKRRAAEHLCQVQVQELTIPCAPTRHAVWIIEAREKIALDASFAGMRRTVGAGNLCSHCTGIGVKADSTRLIVCHFGYY